MTSKEQIKKLMKEILLEENELSLDKDITKKINSINKSLKEYSNKPFSELIISSALDIPCVNDFEFQDFNATNVVSELDNNEQEVQEFIQLKKEYPNLKDTHFDVASYYLKKNYAEQLQLLLKTIEEFKVKIDLITTIPFN
jgi:hypothetical protein